MAVCEEGAGRTVWVYVRRSEGGECGCTYVRRGEGGEWVYVCEEGQGRRVGVRM